MWDYSEKVMEHFLNPRNVGEVADPDAVGEVGNITCGDALKLTLKIDKKDDDRIVEAKFKTFGCGSAIASSSALTEMVVGKTLEDAAQISNQDIADFLGGLPDEKMHCSVMGMEALEAAITSYKGKAIPVAKAEPGEIVCKCFGVTDLRIERVVRENNLTDIDDVTHYVKAGGGCRECHDDIQAIIDRVRADMASEPAPKAEAAPLTNLQRMQKVMQVIEREIRPQLQADGGDIELIDIDGTKVIVALRGACAGCGAANLTLYHFVQEKLREFVEPDITVEAN